MGKTTRKLETGDEGLTGPAVSPASETWAPYYAAAAKDAADRELERGRHVAAARTTMRVAFFVAAVLAAIGYAVFR